MKKNIILPLAAFSALLINKAPQAEIGVAKFNGQTIVHKNEVDKLLGGLNYSGNKEQLYMQVLLQLAEEKAIAAYVDKKNVDSSTEYKKAAAENARVFRINYVLNAEAYKKITPSIRQDIYNKLKKNYEDKLEIRPHMIMVGDLKTAQKIQEELKKGKKFEDLAGQYSSVSSQGGGLLPQFVLQDGFPQPMAKTLLSLKEGRVSDVIFFEEKGQKQYALVKIMPGNRRKATIPAINDPAVSKTIDNIAVRGLMPEVQKDIIRNVEIYDLKGKKITPGAEASEGIPLIGGGVKK